MEETTERVAAEALGRPRPSNGLNPGTSAAIAAEVIGRPPSGRNDWMEDLEGGNNYAPPKTLATPMPEDPRLRHTRAAGLDDFWADRLRGATAEEQEADARKLADALAGKRDPRITELRRRVAAAGLGPNNRRSEQ